MPVALAISGVYIGFVALSGFLVGQLFFGHFSLSASLAGLAGLASATAALKMASQSAWAPAWALWVGVAALLGVALDVVDYYLNMAIPGNYYAWFLIGPFAACITFVTYVAHRRKAAARGL